MLRFLHAADIHLDSPLKGLEKYDGAPVDEIRGATRRALENLVELAIDSEVQFVLIAGDVYDGDWKDHNTGLFFVSQMARLRDAEIKVFVIRGNHDAANKMTRSLRLPENVHVFSHKKPETERLEELGVAIHGRSYAKAAELENLVASYPAASADCFNIGLLHTSLGGAEGHEPYAPCALDDLRSKQYDYWALGHVHQRNIECQDPPVVFPGNIQGRHVRETGAKGCVLVTVATPDPPQIEFRPLDVFRWSTVEVDVSGSEDADDVLQRCGAQLARLAQEADGLPLGVRVTLAGRCAAHQQLVAGRVSWTNQIRACAIDAAGDRLWVEKVRFATAPQQPVDAAMLGDGPLGELLQYIEELRSDQQQLSALGADLDDLRRKLPDELQVGDDPIAGSNTAGLQNMLDDIQTLLTDRLVAKGGER